MEIEDTPKKMDSYNLFWTDEKGKRRGLGFMNKKTQVVGLMRCPECGRENYALNVLSGGCCWCGFKIQVN